MPSELIADSHRRSVITMRGDAGRAWLDSLPALIGLCEQAWSIRLTAPAADLRFNFVAYAQRADGTTAILKVSPPFERETHPALAALRHFDGRGSVRLLECDAERGAVLLEAASPGVPLTSVADDDERVRVAAAVMRDLWRRPPSEHAFPTVAYWASGIDRLLRRRFDGGTGPLPADLVERAEALFRELLASQAEPVVLHGDLHWENILSAERAPWLAIDPKGVVGEPAYEVGPLLRNGLPPDASADEARRILRRRIDLLAELLGFDVARLRAWAFAQLVLSQVWTIDDGGSLNRWDVYADALRF